MTRIVIITVAENIQLLILFSTSFCPTSAGQQMKVHNS